MIRQHFTWQAAVYSSDLSWKAKLALSVIGARMNQYGSGAYPSMDTIAKDMSVSKTTAKEAVREAVEGGWLKKSSRLKAVPKEGRNIVTNDSNEYQIAWPESEEGGAQYAPGVGRNTTRGGAQYAPGVGRNTPPNTPSEHLHEHTFANAQVARDVSAKPDEKGATTKSAQKPAFVLPGWIPVDAWDGFVAMRKAMRKPLTERAMGLLVGELDKLRAAGNPPGEVLDRSTTNCWQGVFALPSLLSNQTKPGSGRGHDAPFDPVAFVNQNRRGQRPGLAGFENSGQPAEKVVNP